MHTHREVHSCLLKQRGQGPHDPGNVEQRPNAVAGNLKVHPNFCTMDPSDQPAMVAESGRAEAGPETSACNALMVHRRAFTLAMTGFLFQDLTQVTIVGIYSN